MSALLLSAVGSTAVHTSVAFSADHLEKAQKILTLQNYSNKKIEKVPNRSSNDENNIRNLELLSYRLVKNYRLKKELIVVGKFG